jgi:hypothetical protein
MVRQMVLLEMMVFQFILQFARPVADADERLVESKLSEWFSIWRCALAWRQIWVVLERDAFDCCVFVEDNGGFGLLKGEVALATNPALKRLKGLLWSMVLIGLDPFL